MNTAIYNQLLMGPLLHTHIYQNELDSLYSEYILSASGFRKIFAKSRDEESVFPEIKPGDAILVGVFAFSFLKFILNNHNENPHIILASDSRPTGQSVLSVLARILSSEHIKVDYIGIASSPEAMAYASSQKSSAFIYVSASHNPIGHNGFKFGLDTGGVLKASQAKALIELSNNLVKDGEIIAKIHNILQSKESESYKKIAFEQKNQKLKALKAYEKLSIEIFTNSSRESEQDSILASLKSQIKERKIGVLADFNGSARISSIDQDFFEKLGVDFQSFNNSIGKIAHGIVPEGDNLLFLKNELERRIKESPQLFFGYLPDNDGDRGNIVYYDPISKSAKIIHAQEVFTLVVLAEIMSPQSRSSKSKKAIVVNDPSSERINELAMLMNIEVHRAEVGEANVVGLAEKLRKDGYEVRILGEGSNGGNITHPGQVRDPLQTLLSLLRLHIERGSKGSEGLYEYYCKLKNLDYNAQFTFTDIIENLPAYSTTSAYEPLALLKIRSVDHALLKRSFEKVFLDSWESKKTELKNKFGITSFEEINYEGDQEKIGFGPEFRSGAERGGLKIRLLREDRGFEAYLWMRGSATEPIFRVMVDSKGRDEDKQKYFLGWLREMVIKADSLA